MPASQLGQGGSYRKSLTKLVNVIRPQEQVGDKEQEEEEEGEEVLSPFVGNAVMVSSGL
jgi:hypothetical protein